MTTTKASTYKQAASRQQTSNTLTETKGGQLRPALQELGSTYIIQPAAAVAQRGFHGISSYIRVGDGVTCQAAGQRAYI